MFLLPQRVNIQPELVKQVILKHIPQNDPSSEAPDPQKEIDTGKVSKVTLKALLKETEIDQNAV